MPLSEALHTQTGPASSDPIADGDARTRFERVGQRLAVEIRLFVRLLPVAARGVRGMAEFLGVDRNLCQRVLAAAKTEGIEFLLHTPSPAQLQRLVEGASLKGIDAERLEGLRSAIEMFSGLVIDGDRAPGAIRKRVRDLMSHAGDAPAEQAATSSPLDALHRAGAAVAGCEMDARINVALMWPRNDIRMGVNVLMVQGHVGYTARATGMPIVVQLADWVSDTHGRPVAETMLSESGAESKRVLLREFCSEPTPTMVPSGLAGSSEHVLEVSSLVPGAKVTVFTAMTTVQDPHPLLDEQDRIRSLNAHMRLPSRRFLFDVYLHRSLASASVPGCAVKAWSPNIHMAPASDWANIIPGGPRLEVLGSDPRQSHTSAWDRHPELVRRAFSIAGREASDFVGYRLDAHMPVWGAHYVVAFDFTHAPQSAEGGAVAKQ